MPSINVTEIDNEIDLKELFYRLWAYKFIIVFTCIMGLALGAFLSSKAEVQYTSKAIFKISNDRSGRGGSLTNELGALVSIPGFNAGLAQDILFEEQIKGRVFIQQLDKKLNFRSDKYFNGYENNPKKDPLWKSVIKQLIRNQSTMSDKNEIIWQGIVSKYKQAVVLNISDNGIISIGVKHNDRNRSAEIANHIMNTVIANSKKKASSEANTQISFLSSTMADALSDLELVQSKLKTFAVENSALPLESFTLGSLQIDALREELERSDELILAASELKKLLQKKHTNEEDYLYLSNEFPIIDQTEFRRVFGQSESMSSWNWPEISTVLAVLDTLSERKKIIQTELEKSLKDAERSSRSLELYAKLKREEKIAEATYTVLIEQVKVQGMFAGFVPENAIIYEMAAPPASSSSPNKPLYILICSVLGFFIGSIIIFLIAAYKKVYYSSALLIKDTNAKFIAKSRNLNALRYQKFNGNNKMLSRKSLNILRDLSIEINKDPAKFIFVSSLGGKIKSKDLVKIIANYVKVDNSKVAMINFTNNDKAPSSITKDDIFGSFRAYKSSNEVYNLYPTSGALNLDILDHKNFPENLEVLSQHFDLIFISADNEDSLSLLRAIKFMETFNILIARVKYTKREMLHEILSIKPIQGLLHG